MARQIEAGQGSSTISIGFTPFLGVYIGQGSGPNQQRPAAAGRRGSSGRAAAGSAGSAAERQQRSGSRHRQGQSCYKNDPNLTIPNTIAKVSSGPWSSAHCGGPAAAAGVSAGSVITSVNGQAVGAPQTLHNALSKFRPGDTVSLTWVTPSASTRRPP